MPVLHLGVIDQLYSTPPSKRGKKASPSTVTTGQVADWLEDDYHVMEVFFALHDKEIVGYLEQGLVGTLENLLMGAPPSNNAFGDATDKIETHFKQFLSNKEMESLGIPGVPTQAALRGVSHRFKRPYKRRAPRPSFIDTGLYQASFKSWVD